MSKDVEISKFMSLVLRHDPSTAGIVLDQNGWTDFDLLCKAIERRFAVDRPEIERIVAENPKKRFTLDGNSIRAAQGHSVEVDLSLEPIAPPSTLFHGTKARFLDSIMSVGLRSQSRQQVHLSGDSATARIVARRRPGEDVILSVDSASMAKDGILFYLSENGVWLTDVVAPKYLRVMSAQELT